MSEQRFTVRDEHLKLLRRANVGWDGCEFGAPAIDCKRPYGNSDVYADIADVLGIEPEEIVDRYSRAFSNEQRRAMGLLHSETQIVLQIALATGAFEVGDYRAPQYTSHWVKV